MKVETEVTATKEAEVKIRRCLVCAHSFRSEWAGERICAKCKSSTAWRRG
jgi:hypothetical protein